MPFDAHKNFAISAVATAPSPAASGTSLVVTGGHGTRFPAVPFNATIWPTGATPDPATAEIVRVTAISTDTFTITRTQESTSARTVIVGDQIMAGITALTATEIEEALKTFDVFTPLDNNPPAANYATFDTRNSTAVLEFDTTTEESAVFVGIIPIGVNLASGIKVIIHWMADTATSGDCRWGAQFERATTDLDADSFDTAVEATTATNGTSGIQTTTTLTITTIDSLAAGERYRLKVYRDVGDAADTMAGDAQLVSVEVRSAA